MGVERKIEAWRILERRNYRKAIAAGPRSYLRSKIDSAWVAAPVSSGGVKRRTRRRVSRSIKRVALLVTVRVTPLYCSGLPSDRMEFLPLSGLSPSPRLAAIPVDGDKPTSLAASASSRFAG